MSRRKNRDKIDDAVDPHPKEHPEASVPSPDEAEVAEQAPVPAQEPGADELLNRLMRLQAEYENYRKRVTREQQDWTRRAVEGLVLDLLPVLDSFDRALKSAEDSPDAGTVLDGMRLVMRQLADALAQNGVQPIEARGEPFDPNHHEAFLSRPVAEGEKPGILVEEIVKGYRMGDRTIRPTRGIVTVQEDQEPKPGQIPGSEDE